MLVTIFFFWVGKKRIWLLKISTHTPAPYIKKHFGYFLLEWINRNGYIPLSLSWPNYQKKRRERAVRAVKASSVARFTTGWCILLKEKSISLKNKHFNKSGPFFIQLLCVIDSFLVFSIYTTRYEITGKIEIVTLASNREQLKGKEDSSEKITEHWLGTGLH